MLKINNKEVQAININLADGVKSISKVYKDGSIIFEILQEDANSNYWFKGTATGNITWKYNNTTSYTITPDSDGNFQVLKSDYDTNITSMYYMFKSCSKLTSLDLSNLNTSNVTDMRYAFQSCSKLTSLDLSNFDTSNVTDMWGMFCGCSSLTSLDLSNFDTSNVTIMAEMFGLCNGLTSLDVSNFDTSNVEMFGNSLNCGMFTYCTNLKYITGIEDLKTYSATDMQAMFKKCTSLIELKLWKWKTDKVTNMSNMFYGCSSLTNLDVFNNNMGNFDTSSVTNMSAMFYGCSSLTSLNLLNLHTYNVTNMSYMFYGCSSLTSLDLSNFIVTLVTDMSNMFYGCSSLKSIDCSQEFKTWCSKNKTKLGLTDYWNNITWNIPD